jgi:hypothetical protein
MTWKMPRPLMILPNSWANASSLIAWFGLSLAMINATTGTASATPIDPVNLSDAATDAGSQVATDEELMVSVPAPATVSPALATATENYSTIPPAMPVTADPSAPFTFRPLAQPLTSAVNPLSFSTAASAVVSSPANPISAPSLYQSPYAVPTAAQSPPAPLTAAPMPPAIGYAAQPNVGYFPAPACYSAPVPGHAAQPTPGYYPTSASGYVAQPTPGYYPTPTSPGYIAQPAPGYYPVPVAPTYPTQPAPGYTVQPAPGYYPAPALTYPTQPAPIAQPPIPQPIPQPAIAQPTTNPNSLLTSTALTPPSIRLQGSYLLQGDQSSARARLSITYPLSPQVLFGGTVDLTDGQAFSDSDQEGLSLNELYLATSLPSLPNLRFVVGQLDLGSYFDRNSFAKDGASQFFNPIFQTNPALSAAEIGSRPGVLVNWSLNDNIEARATAFSSDRSISDFALDGFAGEVGLRFGNAIIRGTYVSARDGGANSSFQEIYQLDRGNGLSGVSEDDREESYGLNAEVFIPGLNMGIFGRYGRYENRDADATADTYSGGVSFLDVFSRNDRLGLAYGRNLSNDRLRRDQSSRIPDALELFYDFRLLPNLNLGFTLQQLNGFSETIAGFRIRTEFDLTPRGL